MTCLCVEEQNIFLTIFLPKLFIYFYEFQITNFQVFKFDDYSLTAVIRYNQAAVIRYSRS